MLFRVSAAAALAAGVVLAACGALYAGLALCHPAALPGDAAWMRGHLTLQGLAALTGGPSPGCFTGNATGAALIRLGLAGPGVAGLLLGLALLWEVMGWPLRRRLLAWRGGHAILAGPPLLLAGIAPRKGGRLWLALDEAEDRAHRRAHRWRDVQALPPLLDPPGRIDRLAPARAASIVAATDSDLANLSLAEAALAAGHKGRLTVRMDQRGVRALAADDLRQRAEVAGAHLILATPDALQLRAALQAAMPGRYRDDRAGTPHIAIAGNGPRLGPLAALVARQGYGLETALPRLSLLTLGAAEAGLPPGVAGSGVVDLAQMQADEGDADRLVAAIVALASSGLRLSAVFCVGDTPGAAVLLAGRWARVLTGLHLPLPPLVALEAPGARAADSAVRLVGPPGLAEIEAAQDLTDRRAAAAHTAYQVAQARVRGDAYGVLPSERPWATLPERYREDNRAAADHAGYKLALCDCAILPLPGAAAALTAAEITRLSRVEHARWVAARRVAGWRLGPRDEAAMTHPDLVEFDALDAAGQDKDADQIRALPGLLARCGERILRLSPVAALPEAMPDAAALSRLDTSLRQAEARHPGCRPLVRVAATPPGLATAEALQARGHLTEVVQSQAPVEVPTPLGLAALIGAHRRQVVEEPAALLAAAPCAMDPSGKVSHDLAL